MKDVAVEVPVPANTIPDLIIPSHIVVPRCTGRFLFQPKPSHRPHLSAKLFFVAQHKSSLRPSGQKIQVLGPAGQLAEACWSSNGMSVVGLASLLMACLFWDLLVYKC